MKWITGLMATAGLVAAAGSAHGAPLTRGTFTMRSSGGTAVGTFSDVTGTMDVGAGTFSVASPSPFFGQAWTAHDGATFGPGTHTVTLVAPGTGSYTGVVVGSGQMGGHILFDYGPTKNIDVVLVWDVTVSGGTKTYTTVDPTVGGPNAEPDGVPGVAMVDGAFPGWSAAFDLVLPSCGDGVVDTTANTTSIDASEGCDDGNTTAGDGCSDTCTVETGFSCSGSPSSCASTCGDGVVASDEACDDGNTTAGDGCSATCTVETGYACSGGGAGSCGPICGDGLVLGSEACDDGNKTAGDGCSASCTVEHGFTCAGAGTGSCASTCGDGLVASDEGCDDGNTTAGDGCSATCTVEAGFLCTDASEPTVCQPGCVGGTADGSIDPGEECDDNNSTSGDGCSPSCRVETGFSCTGNPSSCTTRCGDGIQAGAEQCDDGNTASNDGCAADCSAVETGFTCTGTAPTVCTADCGDGNVLGSEACDDGNTTGGDGCAADCSAVESGYTCSTPGSACTTTCGDGIVAGSEACDDGNTTAGDGCAADCSAVETGYTCTGSPSQCAGICGDGLVRGSEACDDGNTTAGDGCSATCAVESGYACDGADPTSCVTVCGDGQVVGSEACDDGNATSGDGCSATCQTESGYTCATPGSACTTTCGDGIVAGAEVCDDGNTTGGDGCAADCSATETGFTCTGTAPTSCTTTCGDKIVAGKEVCDDGNQISGDGCSADCLSDETCGNGIVDVGEECDGGSNCSSTCTLLGVCGNGVVETSAGEQCDDGNRISGDGCSADCTSNEQCGNGVVDPTEECDDGNTTAGDGCSATCTFEATCGNGTVEPGEQCDDGNTVTGDGCSQVCRTEIAVLGSFTMFDGSGSGGGFVGGADLFDASGVGQQGVSGVWDGAFNTSESDTTVHMTLASPDPFFNANWTAHDIQVFGPGTYSFDTDGDGDPATGVQVSMTVAAGQIGAHMLFDWSVNSDIDVVVVWNTDGTVSAWGPTGATPGHTGDAVLPSGWANDGLGWHLTMTDSDGDGTSGVSMVDGPFVGFNASFDLCFDENGDGTCDCTDSDGDGVCDITAVCGDGLVEGSEECDDGNTAFGDGCSPTCTVEGGFTCAGEPSACQSCGNGIIEGSEGCDDGNGVGGDGCDATCAVETGYVCTGEPSACTLGCSGGAPDGTVDVGEECDDGNTTAGDGCDATCRVETGFSCVNGGGSAGSFCSTTCGDGVAAGTEECDDGNTTAGDGCAANCTVESGWSCDSAAPSVCQSCGNGVVEGTEGCDDGNTTAGDGCSDACAVETGFSCSGEPSDCASTCGDGVVASDEGCDDGNTTGGDGCAADCSKVEVCGDGTVDEGEECDDGNTVNTDDCLDTCVAASCGDGYVEADVEECDDGNTDNTDGCTNDCLVDTDGDGVGDASLDGTPIDLFVDNAFESGDRDGDGVGDNADACDEVTASAVHASALTLPSSGTPLNGTLKITNLNFQMPGVGFDLEISPGDDGGIILGEYQNAGSELTDGPNNNFIIDSHTFIFFGNQVSIGTYREDPAGNRPGAPFSAPVIIDNGDGTVSFDFQSWTAYWNGNFFNQGPTDTTLLNFHPDNPSASTDENEGTNEPEIAVNGTHDGQFVGTYDASTGAMHLEWNSLIVGKPFDQKIGHWILDGTFEPATGGVDSDGDGVLDSQDICPGYDDHADQDGDGTPDGCDVCPTDKNDDADGDCLCANPDDPSGAFGFDDDNDGDGVKNTADAFPDDPTETLDTDGDGTGNNADLDDDGDGVPDVIDSAPLDAAVTTVVLPEAGEPSGSATVDAAQGGATAEVDAGRVDSLDAAATYLEGVAADLPADDPDKAQADADAAAARAAAEAAAKVQGVKVEVPSGTTVEADVDGDGTPDDSVVIGVAPAEMSSGESFTISTAESGTVETTVVGQPVAPTPQGATFDPYALLTLTYADADVPDGVLDESALAVVRTNDDGSQTVFSACDDSVDRNGDGTVDSADQDVDCVASRDTDANTITVRTSHFSDFTVAVGDTDGDGIADNLDTNPTVPEAVPGGAGPVGDRNLPSRISRNLKDGVGGCVAARGPSPRVGWVALALLLLPLGVLATLRHGRRWMRTLLGSLLLLALVLPQPAQATTTLFPTGFGAKMAAMGGAANAAGDDATSLAVNPANMTKIDGWRLDLDVGALIFNGSYTDHNSDLASAVNRDAGGRFEINESTLFLLPTMGIVHKSGRWGIGFGMWGKGGGGFAVQDWGFNDVTPADMGGGRNIFITNGSDLVGTGGLNAQNAVRRDNYTLMIIGRFGLAISYDITDDLTIAVEPLQDYGFLKFGIFGSTATSFDANRDGIVDQFEGTVARGLPFKRFGTVDKIGVLPDGRIANNFPSFGRLFGGRTFTSFMIDGGSGTTTYLDTVGERVTRPEDGVLRIAKFFDQDLHDKAIHKFDVSTGASEGFVRDATTRDVMNSVAGSLKNQSFYDPTKYTDQESDFIIDEFFGLFQDQFVDAGFGMGEVTGYATGRGFEDFANAVKLGATWKVNDWLTIGGSYTSKSSIIMRDGGLRFDFTNQIQQGLDVGMRSFLFMNTIFDKLGMQKIAGFVDDVADGRTVDFGTMFDPNPSDGKEQGNLDQIDTVEELRSQVTGFGALVGGFGADHTIPTNEDIDAILQGSTSVKPTDGRAAVATPDNSVELLTRSEAGLFRQFASLMGFVDNQTFETVSNEPNYKIPKRLNDSANNAAQQAAPGLDHHDASSGKFAGGGVIDGTIVRQVDDAEVQAYYTDIARFLRGFGVKSIIDPAVDPEGAFRQVQALLNPANYSTPQEFLQAYDALRSQFSVVGDFRTDVTIELPQQAELGIEIRPTKRLRLTSDIKWADYSAGFQDFAANLRSTDNEVFQRFLGLAATGSQLDFGEFDSFTFKENLNWHDQWIFNFGGAYDLLDNFTVMAGYSFTGRHLNDLWNDFGKAKSVMDGQHNMAVLPAFGFETASLGCSYRWNNKELSFALERAFTTSIFSGDNLANSQYSDSKEQANQESVHVQYSLLF